MEENAPTPSVGQGFKMTMMRLFQDRVPATSCLPCPHSNESDGRLASGVLFRVSGETSRVKWEMMLRYFHGCCHRRDYTWSHAPLVTWASGCLPLLYYKKKSTPPPSPSLLLFSLLITYLPSLIEHTSSNILCSI